MKYGEPEADRRFGTSEALAEILGQRRARLAASSGPRRSPSALDEAAHVRPADVSRQGDGRVDRRDRRLDAAPPATWIG